jgi:hypothetical protein
VICCNVCVFAMLRANSSFTAGLLQHEPNRFTGRRLMGPLELSAAHHSVAALCIRAHATCSQRSPPSPTLPPISRRYRRVLPSFPAQAESIHNPPDCLDSHPESYCFPPCFRSVQFLRHSGMDPDSTRTFPYECLRKCTVLTGICADRTRWVVRTIGQNRWRRRWLEWRSGMWRRVGARPQDVAGRNLR